MPISQMDGAATISTTEYSLPNNSTTLTPQTDDCVLQVEIDVSAMAAGDQFRFRLYEKINGAGGGTQQTFIEKTATGKQNKAVTFPTYIVSDGWDVTAIKLAGTDRALKWSLRKVT